jgi:hypothetical protein
MPVTPPPRAKRQQTTIHYAPRAPQAPRINQWGPFGLGGVQRPGAVQPSYIPAASQAGGVNIAAPTPTGGGDIRDPAYWLSLSNIDEYYGTHKAQIGEQGRQDKEALDRALTMLGANSEGQFKANNYDISGTLNQGSFYRDIQSAKTNANKAGLFYSGQLGQNIGDITQGYTQKVGGLKADYTGRQNLRDIDLSSTETQFAPGGIKYKEAGVAAADRRTQALINNPPAPTPTQADLVSQIVQHYIKPKPIRRPGFGKR